VRSRRIKQTVIALAIAALPLSSLVLSSPSADAQQPKGKPTAPVKPGGKPLPPKVDAQPPSSEDSTSADGGKPAASSADTPAPPPVAEPIVDGGKASPLNPQPAELPSNAVDAGIPVDYDRLLADIAALRARVAAVADNLYQSRIAIALQLDNDHARIARLTVSLDDGVVFTAPPTFAASDMTQVYDHAVAPGRHTVTVDVDRKDARDEAFRTSQRSRFTVDVPRDNRVEVQVKVIDDSSMGADFPSDKSGKYDLRFRVKAVAKGAGK
jgi:hypothetical protein